jgi:amidase
MKRRSFLKNSLATGAILSVNACQSSLNEDSTQNANIDQFELNEISIYKLIEGIERGDLTSEKVTQLYLDRIAAIDKNGPSLNAVIEINPDALQMAKNLDEELKNGKKRGPLHGIPIMLKDNIDTAGKMLTTAGSLALEGNYARQNSWVAQKLIDAGAVIMAKTNLSEWANFRSLRSSSGWSGRGGQTRNPYITDRNPCGSSSGSGVAASANLCAAAIGTETNGSVVCPSSINGLVGIKPTVGLVSRAGIIPISQTQDTAGPMCRTVEDAALILGALTGIDERDKYTTKSQGKSFSDYTKFLDKDSLRNKRIGLAKHYTGFHTEVDKLTQQAIQDMRDLGAVIVDVDAADLNNASGADAYNLLLFEFKHDLNAYLENCPDTVKYRTLEALIKFNNENADREMPFFDQEIFLAAQEKGDLDSDAYKIARENVLKANGPEGIDKVLEKYELDAIIAPTNAPSWPIDVINGDHFIGGSSSPAARSGYPNITVPMGFVHGLPIGLSFFAEAWSEPKLISLAYAYEQATKHRKAPEFIPTFDHQLKK